ncbi:hypothetical protein [Curtobacterium aurantiacum]|uniref:Uncharacterized protein n=1 Tax=Curtobacterium aurantiacum TaxID=3236919 RepID=A0ABS5VNG9_9MICO|nr:hypothetical protein [Curtobacterium flaccumfaciens]MBT1546110.1 hypothetical protein [Curtobacterium flaccumfaciens pv. flaccumfaciens]MBT1589592.1 hypothetical protein [Curtobacterium flaccumfaciens pv. flaccumfaciens]
MLQRPDGVPRSGRARGAGRTPMSPARRLSTLRWVIVAVWLAVLITRIVVLSVVPGADLSWYGLVEFGAIALGLVAIAIAVVRTASARRRQADEALALAIRRIDPTVWLVPAAPTPELRGVVDEVRPDTRLGSRVTWAFGATEASLWELDERRATRLLVIRWSRVVHVGLEDVAEDVAEGIAEHAGGSGGARRACAVAIHHIRPDDTPAVATFFVRTAPGSGRLLGRGPRLDRLVSDLARERIVA